MPSDPSAIFEPWLARWRLTPEADPFKGPNSWLLPVRRDGRSLMLKAAMHRRETRAAAYLQWLGGEGAVEVLEREADAVLMERAAGERSLAGMEEAGDAEGALSVLCEVAERLHAPRGLAPPEARTLESWFEALHDPQAEGVLRRAASLAAELLASQEDIRVLHGDLHHWNVLDAVERGWLAIDPNGLIGERAFDYALMVLPANLREDADPGVLADRAGLVARLAGVDRRRLLSWVCVQAALWAAWSAPGRDWIAIAGAAEIGQSLA